MESLTVWEYLNIIFVPSHSSQRIGYDLTCEPHGVRDLNPSVPESHGELRSCIDYGACFLSYSEG